MTAMKHKTYHHLMPFKCPSFLTLQHFSCNFPCSTLSLRRAHLLSDWFFSHSKYLSRRDFLGNQKHQGYYSASCMILFMKYSSQKPTYCMLSFPRILSFPFTRTSLQHQKPPNIVPLWSYDQFQLLVFIPSLVLNGFSQKPLCHSVKSSMWQT